MRLDAVATGGDGSGWWGEWSTRVGGVILTKRSPKAQEPKKLDDCTVLVILVASREIVLGRCGNGQLVLLMR
jgi:hypothetical protein